ncbi:MAG: twin-arginine translocase TatA/TatE family subunit [Endomicrobium sp.]|jgi:sec-independent protein translocase protein TatA|nr:twin-arginine translocase TatA/TatE family subunit [Endomicrobium sp.]
MSIGFTEILVILIVILLLFGAKRIPEIAKAFGRAAHEFKKAKEDIKKESKELLEEAEHNAKIKSDKITKKVNKNE